MRRAAGRLVGLLAVLACLVGISEPAAAVVVFTPDEAEALSDDLADATEAQGGICYGWRVFVNDASGESTGTDSGGSLGPGAMVEQQCDRWVVFTASVTYTSELSEAEDDSAFDIVSNLDPSPTIDDISAVGTSEQGLLGDDIDVVVANAVLALPGLVAELGHAPPVPIEPAAEALAPGEKPTNSPGSDWLRKYWAGLAAGVVLLLMGLVVVAYVMFVGPLAAPVPDNGGTQDE